jgi:hypothetical protein
MPRLISEKYFKLYGRSWAMHSDEMLKTLGVEGSKLPLEGLPQREIQGIQVWVVPHVPHPNGRKSSKHRVLCACPNCGRVLSAGRLHQHKC